MKFIGIDPGKHGAMAVIEDAKVTIYNREDGYREALEKAKSYMSITGQKAICCLEHVPIIPKNGSCRKHDDRRWQLMLLIIIPIVGTLVLLGTLYAQELYYIKKGEKCRKQNFLAQRYDCPELGFERFLSFYALNPHRWELGDAFVRCNPTGGGYGPRFVFSWEDQQKYEDWRKESEKKRKEKLRLESYDRDMESMIELVKKDLENYKKSHGLR